MVGFIYETVKTVVSFIGEHWVWGVGALVVLGILVALLPPVNQER